MGKVAQKNKQQVIHVHIRPISFSSDLIPEKTNFTSKNKGKFHGQSYLTQPGFPRDLYQSSERSIPSISRKKNPNRVSPSSFLDEQKNSILINLKSEKKSKGTYCGLSLWSCLLLYLLIALLVISAAITIGILTINQGKSSSTTTSTITSTTSVTDTSTTSTSSSTTTTFYTCSNFTVTANWDYTGNDIISNVSFTFASYCAWCMNVTLCVAFTLNPWNACYVKNSIGTGGIAFTNSIGVAL